MSWKPTEEKKVAFAVCKYDGDGPHRLPLRFGDVVSVLEECQGWYRGHLYYDPSQKGIFPVSCVHLKESTVIHRGSEDEVILKGEPHCVEAGEALREWREHWHRLYTEHSSPFLTVCKLIHDVIEIRTNLMSGAIASDNLQNLKAKLTTLIDVVNDKLGLPMTPRRESGDVMDTDKCSTLDVYHAHQATSQDIISFTDDSSQSWARRCAPLTDQEWSGSATSHSHHLYLSVESINHVFPEDCELYFSLYDKEGRQYLTERWCIRVPKSTEGARFDGVHKLKGALFVDLGNRDIFSKSPHLVCHVVRNGRMLFADRKYNSSHTFRRPYACGVLDPSSVLKPFAKNEYDQEERPPEEFVMPLSIIARDNNMDFFTFQDNAIRKLAAKGNTLTDKSSFTLHVTLQLFKGDLSQVTINSPKLNHVTMVPRLGFPEIILPGDVRNDIYLILDKAEFDKGAKSAERNVEIAVTVCDEQGRPVENAICTAAGFKPVTEYRSFIFYHNNSPRWGEVIRLNLPFEMLSRVHVKLGFRHLAKTEHKSKEDKTFSFAFLKIMNPDGSIIQDGQYELCVYKVEQRKWKNAAQYLSLPSKKADSHQIGHQTVSATNMTTASGQIQRNFKEGIWMSTICCSTKLTQRIELLALLKWRQNQPALKMTLDRVAQVPGSEMFKFLQDALDCLFQILTEHSDKYCREIFNVLIHILGFLQQGRFQHFKPVMDLYVRRHFSAALAYTSLMATLNEQVKGWQDETTGDRLKAVFEVLEHLFHFITRSFALHSQGRPTGNDTLTMSLNHFFSGLVTIMRAPADERDKRGKRILNMQSAILENLPAILPDLKTVMSEKEIAAYMSNVLNAVPLHQPGIHQHKPSLSDMGSPSVPPHPATLSHHKLTFIMNILTSPIKILRNSDARVAILPTLVCHLEDFVQIRIPVLGYTSETTGLCVQTVGRMLAILQFGEERLSWEVIRHVLKLLKPILGLSFAMTRDLPAAAGNWVNLLSLFQLCPIEDFRSFCDEQVQLQEFIGELTSVFQRAVREPFFPDEWIIMHLVQNRIFLKIVRCCSEIMRSQLMNPRDYEHELFQQSFELCVDVITQKCLQMEKTSLLKKKRLRHKFGDLRLEMGFVVMGLWGVLGNAHKEQFIVSSMNDLLKMSLVRMPELRRITLPIIWDVMQVDRATAGTIKRVEAEVLDKLDNLLQAGWGDDEYKETFADIILPHCHKQNDRDFGKQCLDFVAHVTRLIELVIDFRNVPSDDYNKDNRMGCMFNLLHFYHEIDKEELYIRYVYKLSALHRKDERYTEAALTLLLHGKTLKWDSTVVVAAEGKYPRHSALARKEQLYKEAIQLLDLGKSWEEGIRLCKELGEHYEMETFDYNKLGAILDTQAQFFRKVISELRVEPEYFRVGYYGRGFPHFLRNKEFVHRGLPYEQLGSFRRRLNYEFPNAEFLTFTTAPDESFRNSSGQHLQVFRVNPVPEERDMFRGRDVDEKILNYYKCNDLCRFKYDRPYHRGEKDKSCEFATLWIERTTMETSSRFPGVLSFYPVARAEAVDISPLELAIETVENKNKEIATLTTACLDNVAFNLQSLTMILSGVIDAAVNGGIDNYRKIFFTPSYLEDFPQQEDRVKHLQKLIEDQCNTLRKALDAHRRRITTDVEPLHNHMEVTYTKMRRIIFPHEAPADSPMKPQLPRSNTMKNRELPPLPVQIQEPSKLKTMSNRPKRVPSSRFGRGNLIQSTIPEGKPRPPPPSFAAPRPPPSPLGREMPPTEAYEVIDIDDRRRSLTIATHTADDLMEEMIPEGDDYEPIDFDVDEIRRSSHENGTPMHLTVPKQQGGDSASVSSGSSTSIQMNFGSDTPQVEGIYAFDSLSGTSPPQVQGQPVVESVYSTELDKGAERVSVGSAPAMEQTTTDSGHEVYGFDHLSQRAPAPTAAGQQQESAYGFDHLDQQREAVYSFDRLDQPTSQNSAYGFDRLAPEGTQGAGSNQEENVYELDTLDHTPATNNSGAPPSLPPRPKPSTPITPSRPAPPVPQQLETPPKIPEKRRKTMRKMNAISESSVTSEGVPTTPTTPSATNGPSAPPSYPGVILRDANKPPPPVPRPRSQTESIMQRIETSPTPQPPPPATPSTPPIPRPRQGSSSKGPSLISTSSSVADTPPALPPKPSQSPPKQPSVPVRKASAKESEATTSLATQPTPPPPTAPSSEPGSTPPPLPMKPKKSPELARRLPAKSNPQLEKLMAKFEAKK